MSTPLTELRLPPPAPPAEDPDFESRVNELIGKQWLDLKAAYWVYHSWIWESLLMYSGNLWLKWNRERRGYEVDTPEDDFTPRPRINRFAPAIDAISSVFQDIPEIEAVPAPRDDFKKMGIAEVCNKLSDYFIKDCALRSDFGTDEDKCSIASAWFSLAGCFFTNVFVEEVPIGQRPVLAPQPAVGMQCTGCDTYGTVSPQEAEASGGACPQCGQPMQMTQTETMQPQEGEDGQPMMEPITEKHVRCIIEEPLAAYPKSGSKSMKDAGFIILANRMSLDRIWSELGIEDAHEDSEQPDGWNTTAENSLNFFYLGYANSKLRGKDAAMVLRLYCEPNKVKDFPEGIHAIYINGECKKCEPWPFGDEHPLTKVDFRALPTLFFPRCVAFDIAGSMREFLDYSSLIKLHGMVNAVAPVVCEEGDNHSEITGRGDKVITWVRTSPNANGPRRLEAGSLDSGIYEMRKLTLEDIEQIAQTVSVFRGEKPEGADSGVALDTLRVQANAMFAGPVKNYANGWKEAVRKGVKLYQKHYTVTQLIEIVGDNHLDEIADFRACNLDTSIEWIATAQGMPRTREEQRKEMIDLFDRGMLDVNDPSVREKAFELFGETGMLATFNKDATRARYENSMIKSGGQPIFMPEFDDNAVHAQIHLDQIKSMDFLGWSPEAKQVLMQHTLQTQQVMAQQQAAQVQQVPPQGGATSPNPPAQPGNSAAPPPHPGGLPQ